MNFPFKKQIVRLITPFIGANALKVRDSDTFLVSYPRSGNTFLRYLLAQIIDSDAGGDMANLNRLVPDMYKVKLWIGQRRPRIIKSHEHFQPQYPKSVYIHRDGREVAVSFYNFRRFFGGRDEEFSVFLDRFLSGRLAFGAWHKHVEGWVNNAHEDGQSAILLVSYTDLINDTENELTRICKFLGIDATPERIRASVEYSSKENMRKGAAQVKGRLGFADRTETVDRYFTPELLDRYWDVAGEVSLSLGYTK